jgi:glutamate-1-semialdehyde 2,1-aminomutase
VLTDAGIILIFDEVITGFRLGIDGGAGWTGVTPDLATYGKIVGGGLPLGAFGGRREIMSLLAPEGKVYQAGTLSGNPLAVAAGSAAVRELVSSRPYEELARKTLLLKHGIEKAAERAGIPVTANSAGSLLTVFFQAGPERGRVIDFSSASASDTKRYASFFTQCLQRGVLLPPSQFEALFVSTAHSDSDLEHTLRVMEEAFRAMSNIHE